MPSGLSTGAGADRHVFGPSRTNERMSEPFFSEPYDEK
jgi:hypothetical protein